MVNTIADLSMMKSPNRWPCWPMLPLKHAMRKSDGMPLIGFLFESNKYKYTVFVGNMLDAKNISKMPREEFKSYEEVVAAGWVVD